MRLLSDRFQPVAPAPEFNIDDLPSTIWQGFDGLFYCNCCCCGKDMDLEGDVEDVDEDSRFWCGGSPRCCP